MDTDDRRCTYCDAPLVRRPGEPFDRFTQRRFCSSRGAALWQHARKRPSIGDPRCTPPTVPDLPGAHDDIPTQCVKCGHPWAPDAEALACHMCGTRYVVRELLLSVMRWHAYATLSATLEREDP